MLSVKIPIFEWGANLKKVKKAKLDFKNAELELSRNSRLMNLEAQSALKNIYDGYQLIQTAEIGLKQAEENLRVTNNKWHCLPTCSMHNHNGNKPKAILSKHKRSIKFMKQTI
mgnify:CR=1 FL=1